MKQRGVYEKVPGSGICGCATSTLTAVRYSHLSPDFVQDVVDKLAPQPVEELSNQASTGDTESLASAKRPTESVH